MFFDLIPITCISAIILFNRSIIKISKATSVILYFIWLWYCKCTMALVICPPRAVVVHNHQVEVRCYYTYNIYWTKNLLGLEEEVVKGVKIDVTSCRSSWEKCRPLPDTKKKKDRKCQTCDQSKVSRRKKSLIINTFQQHTTFFVSYTTIFISKLYKTY